MRLGLIMSVVGPVLHITRQGLNKNGVFDRLKGLFVDLMGKNRFGREDFVLLNTVMMLAAVDGEISKEELSLYRMLAQEFRGTNAASSDARWERSVRAMAYIGFLTEMLPPEEVVREYVREAGRIPRRFIAPLERMASADGDYSRIERDCVSALAKNASCRA